MPSDSCQNPNLSPPPMPETHETALFDKENAFLLYAVFCGDAERTAHALDTDASIVRALAEENQWDKKLKPIIDLKQSSRAGDVERAVNRALNFVQAHRYRLFLERVLRQLTGMSKSDLDAFLFPREYEKKQDKIFQKFTTRPLADLASALEKCHSMTYLALNDTATERRERTEEGDEGATASEMHLRLAEAMAAAGEKSKSIRGLVLDAQLQIGQELANIDLKPPHSDALPDGE